MKRSIRIVVLTTVVILAVGTLLVFSQGKKGQVQDPVCGLWVDKSTELSFRAQRRNLLFLLQQGQGPFQSESRKVPSEK